MSLKGRLTLKNRSVLGGATIVLLAFLASSIYPTNLDFPKNTAGPTVELNISNGEIGSSIAKSLVSLGVVKSVKPFISALKTNSKARSIAPGIHRIQSHITTNAAIEQLADPKLIANLVVVKDGSTLSDVLTSLKIDKNILYSPSDIRAVKPLFPNPLNSLEGSLHPAAYSFGPNTSLSHALSEMVRQSLTDKSIEALSKGYSGFSPFQLLTISSLIQIEGDPSSATKVARVIYNRLKLGMPLQLNSTVQYASGKRGRIALSAKATQINSPYNTYRNLGLPPTPISNPSEFALAATIAPTPGDWLYFITVAPGDTRFTKSFSEFQLWTTEFNKNLSLGKFK